MTNQSVNPEYLEARKMLAVFDDIRAERQRQDERWGADRQHPDMLWYTILGEEYGEVGRAILEGLDGTKLADGQVVMSSDGDDRLYEELIQVAAVSTAHAEAIRARRPDIEHRPPTKIHPRRPISLKRATIGSLITVLEDIKTAGGGTREVMFDGHLYPDGTIASYRGYYEQAALGWSGKLTDVTVDTLIEVLRGAIGRTFVGWKGSDYEFHTDTPLWLANEGATDGERSIMVPALRISRHLVHLGTVNYDESPEIMSMADTIGKIVRS